LAIEPGTDAGWWLATVTDMETGIVTTIRQLDGGGDHLESPMVWAEVFAPCDGPPVSIAWSDLEVAVPGGRWRRIDEVTVNYQDYAAGGCTNTTSRRDERGRLVQSTNTARTTANRAVLSLRQLA
jgi:hypothetical protein